MNLLRGGGRPRGFRMKTHMIIVEGSTTDSLLVACAEILGGAGLQATVQSEVKLRMEVISPWLAELPPLRVKEAALWESVGVCPVPWDCAFNMLKELPTQQALAGDPSTFALGRPELLTSTRRAAFLREKKRLEEMEALG